jgi:hypothetical protein
MEKRRKKASRVGREGRADGDELVGEGLCLASVVPRGRVEEPGKTSHLDSSIQGNEIWYHVRV